MRGERIRRMDRALREFGSSPHARGTHGSAVRRHHLVRFIPACAGNAFRCVALCRWVSGSSPHARGTPDAELRRLDVARFIPACAGNASMRATTRSPQPVHPRMRGERCVTHSMCPAIGGSSPHARGTLPVQPKYFAPTRFIPACAGNANIVLYSAPFISVHPRMRGERCASCAPPFVLNGSSPHARGTPDGNDKPPHVRRFIPACAGNARASLFQWAGMSVHPRMRGERRSYLREILALVGSSPHARGTRWKCFPRPDPGRFIPACAGNACTPPACTLTRAVHPRMRGERGTATTDRG